MTVVEMIAELQIMMTNDPNVATLPVWVEGSEWTHEATALVVGTEDAPASHAYRKIKTLLIRSDANLLGSDYPEGT